MSQLVDNHPLSKDFPELKETIHRLKQSDAHFAKLNDEYESVDKSIVRAEQGVEHVGQIELDALKIQRVKLKDQLYALLTAA